jgi:predicted AlkP superfamily pyrophosphatase or phosphodiesterase
VSDRVHVFVLVDGLGWRVIEDRAFLDDLLPHRQALRTVLGYSSGAIPTLLTGRTPAEHGHWNLVYYDPEGSPFRWLRRLGFLPESILDNRLGRKLLKEAGRRALGLGPLFDCAVAPSLLPWFNWVEKRSLYEPGGVAGAPSIFDELAQAGARFRTYSYHQFSDEQVMTRAARDVREGEADVFFLYLSGLDAVLHSHCQEPEVVEWWLAWYAEGLRSVFDAALARAGGSSTLAIFSDHGMTPVQNHYDMVGAVESLGLRAPKDYLAVYDSTMARFWFFNERSRRRITALLSTVPCGRILSDGELQKLGVFFPDRRYGELILLLAPGWLLSASGFNGSRWRPAGMHGYHPDDPWSDGVFLSSEPPPQRVTALPDVHTCLHAWAATRDARS